MGVAELLKKSHDFNIDQDPVVVDLELAFNGTITNFLGVKMRLYYISSEEVEEYGILATSANKAFGILVTNTVALPHLQPRQSMEFLHPTIGRMKVSQLIPLIRQGVPYGYRGAVEVFNG